MIGSRFAEAEEFRAIPKTEMSSYCVSEELVSDSNTTLVPTRFVSESLAEALRKSDFDQQKVSLFVWLGDTGYHSLETIMSGLSFIASLPKGSGVLLDYVAEQTALGSLKKTALDALSSCFSKAGEVLYLIEPEAVKAMLRGLGFRHILDLNNEDGLSAGSHLVSAVV
jgi:O-methyltransferase involved in polyketide biosynthesis